MTQWWLSTDMIGKPGSPKAAGPFSTREDAFAARRGMESLGANLSVFEEDVPPAVELPKKPTFGLLSWICGPNTATPGQVVTVLDEWHLAPCVSGNVHKIQVVGSKARCMPQVPLAAVVAFTEAVAVPKDALDELRDHYAVRIKPFEHLTLGPADRAIRAFLAATDEANGSMR